MGKLEGKSQLQVGWEIWTKSLCTEMKKSGAAEICNYLGPVRDEWLCLFPKLSA